MQAIKIHDNDKVAVALEDLKKGTEVTAGDFKVVLSDDIARGHKFALTLIKEGDEVIKYGCPIGIATCNIAPGCHVHSHNVRTNLQGEGNYSFNKISSAPLKRVERTFMGYQRENGRVGIRNELWIIPTVFCVNAVARELESYAKSRLGSYSNVDNCTALTHPYGCSQMGEDEKATQKLLAALCCHPNAGAVLVLGLGCENNNLGAFKKFLDPDDKRLYFLNCQEVQDEYEEGCRIIDLMMENANKYKRSQVPLEKLIVGLKCGGSDGLSGITANPLIGRLTDLLIGSGGTAVMTEVPEMFGAEQLLMNRAKDEAVFNKCVSLINNFKHYFTSHGQVVSENPSPGNKAGGITTLEDKSLGCIQKGGSAQVCDVLLYGDKVRQSGLNLLQGPGNDGVSCTALAASGCHMILFSTGRGTPFATVVPTIKIATNTALCEKKHNWIDFDAGVIVAGVRFDTLTEELLDYVINTASGISCKSESRDIHEIIIWKDGVTM